MTRTSAVCVGALDHRPQYAEVDKHHVFPLYMASLLGVPSISVTVPLCAGDHDLTHHLLRHLVNDGTYHPHQPSDGIRVLVRRAYAWWTATILGAAT